MSIAQKLLSMLMVNEMAFSKQKATGKVEALQFKIAEHLVKIIAFPNHSSVTRWIIELEGWRKTLSRFNQPKKKQMNYDYDFLYLKLWSEPLGTVGDTNGEVKELKNLGFTFPSNFKLNRKQLKKLTKRFINDVLQKQIFNARRQLRNG